MSVRDPTTPFIFAICSLYHSRFNGSMLTIALQFQPVNPRPFLQARVGTELIIRLKWGQTEYKGTLESIDSYMNVLLRDTEEFIDGKNTGTLGLVLIRCNNILWMGSADSVEMTDLGLK
ncbi:hypothetical protein MPDQ_000621 [Monascus purpureus]|uniref:Sm protein F n=1 Tax=Monascus purpureus TaxID=5098 RepID=A0A507QSZ0_MONPU|nr:hypothetical protein MPDQ_000621 [Monascus purpureus]BDD55128.1 hypothetical protein MAP00_000679 [Monascus purpureus]